MAKKIDDLKTMSSNEIVDYLYKVGLSNVFDNYNKSANALNQAKKQQTENAYYLDQMNKRYLGEYASNVGLNDLSTSLQGIANDYAKNLSSVNQNYDLANAELSDAYNKQRQDLYNSYAVDILNQKQQEEQMNQQFANELLDQALTSGFYGYNEDGSLMNLQDFLNQEQYANMNEYAKKYLLDQDKYNRENIQLASFTPDEIDLQTGLRVDKNRVMDYFEYLKDTGDLKSFPEIQLLTSEKSIGITDGSGNYYVASGDAIDDTNGKKFESATGINKDDKPTSGILTTRFEEENGSRPVVDDVLLYKDEGTGYYSYYYYDGKKWHYMARIDDAVSKNYIKSKREKEKEESDKKEYQKEANKQWWKDFWNNLSFSNIANSVSSSLGSKQRTDFYNKTTQKKSDN